MPTTKEQGYCSSQPQKSQSVVKTAVSWLQGRDIWAARLAGSEAGAFINTERDRLPATPIELQYLAQREQKLICSQLVGRKCVSSWRRWHIALWVFFFFFFWLTSTCGHKCKKQESIWNVKLQGVKRKGEKVGVHKTIPTELYVKQLHFNNSFPFHMLICDHSIYTVVLFLWQYVNYNYVFYLYHLTVFYCTSNGWTALTVHSAFIAPLKYPKALCKALSLTYSHTH